MRSARRVTEERGAKRRSAGQDEAVERLHADVHRVDFGFESRHLRGYDPQRHFAGREILARRRKVRAKIEQVVLDRPQLPKHFA